MTMLIKFCCVMAIHFRRTMIDFSSFSCPIKAINNTKTSTRKKKKKKRKVGFWNVKCKSNNERNNPSFFSSGIEDEGGITLP